MLIKTPNGVIYRKKSPCFGGVKKLLPTLFVFGFSVLAASPKEESFKVLQSAVEISGKTNFKAEFIIPPQGKGAELRGITIQKVNPDGTVWSKTEIKGKGVDLTVLQNDEGSFTIIGKKAIKNATAPKVQNVQFAEAKVGTIPEALEQFDIKMNRQFINGRDSYIIVLGKPASLVKDDKTVASTEYTIGVGNKFIYSTKMYNRNGELMSALNYSTVDTNVVLNDQMFEIPKDIGITVATDKKMRVKAIQEATNVVSPPPRSRLQKQP